MCTIRKLGHMQSPMGEILNPLDRQILYDHWENIEVIKYVSKDTYLELDQQPIRDAMVKTLREGLQEGTRKRHVLSLKELLPLVNNYLGKDKSSLESGKKPLKLTALYYHRDKLIEDKLLVEVAKFLEGKRYVSYYGRTAKAFIGSDPENEWMLRTISLFRDAILAVNPNVDLGELDSTLSELERQLESTDDFMEIWIKKNEIQLMKNDIDIIRIIDTFSPYIVLIPSLQPIFISIGKLLKFEFLD